MLASITLVSFIHTFKDTTMNTVNYLSDAIHTALKNAGLSEKRIDNILFTTAKNQTQGKTHNVTGRSLDQAYRNELLALPKHKGKQLAIKAESLQTSIMAKLTSTQALFKATENSQEKLKAFRADIQAINAEFDGVNGTMDYDPKKEKKAKLDALRQQFLVDAEVGAISIDGIAKEILQALNIKVLFVEDIDNSKYDLQQALSILTSVELVTLKGKQTKAHTDSAVQAYHKLTDLEVLFTALEMPEELKTCQEAKFDASSGFLKGILEG
jgi:hypothetical protein